MTIRILSLLALLCFMSSADAFRVLGQPERPFELTLSQLTLPKDTNGTVILTEGDNGRMSTRRFVDGAKFLVDGREVAYADLLLIVAEQRRSSQSTTVNVFIDIATDRVTRVAIHRPRH